MIVVDDGSTEPLPELPPEVELIRQQNRGVAHARNAGLARVETPYALVLDADDRLAPGALAILRAPLEADPSLGFTYGRMRFFGAWEGEMAFPPFDPYELLYRHTIGLSALARREVFERDRRLRPDLRAARGLGAVGPCPGQGLARTAGRRGHGRVPTARGLEALARQTLVPPDVSQASRQACRALQRTAGDPARAARAGLVPVVLGLQAHPRGRRARPASPAAGGR